MGVGACLGSVRSGVLRRYFYYRSANEALLASKAYMASMRGLRTCSHPSHHQQGQPSLIHSLSKRFPGSRPQGRSLEAEGQADAAPHLTEGPLWRGHQGSANTIGTYHTLVSALQTASGGPTGTMMGRHVLQGPLCEAGNVAISGHQGPGGPPGGGCPGTSWVQRRPVA